jgi:hypothetical protein
MNIRNDDFIFLQRPLYNNQCHKIVVAEEKAKNISDNPDSLLI